MLPTLGQVVLWEALLGTVGGCVAPLDPTHSVWVTTRHSQCPLEDRITLGG